MMRKGGVRSRASVALIIVAVMAALAGCSGLATNTPVKQGLPIENNRVRVGYVPPGPSAGDSPQQIIRGFIRAGSASDGDYEVAKSYLTPGAAKNWTPDGEVIIFATSSAPTYSQPKTDEWSISVSQVGSISAAGVLENAAPGTSASAQFKVVQVDGEWRIAAVPEKFRRWIEKDDRDRLFRTYAVYYVSVASEALVPDVRWFPDDHLPTRLTEAMLTGVPPYLKGAVVTGFPQGSALRVGSVPVDGGVASLDVTGGFATDSDVRRMAWLQAAATLTQLTDVATVEVLNDGARLEFTGRPADTVNLADLGAERPGEPTVQPIIRQDGALNFIDVRSGEVLGPTGPEGRADVTMPVVDPAYRSLAISADYTQVAAVSRDGTGVSLWRSKAQYDVPLPRRTDSVGRPSYDPQGKLWIPAVVAGRPDRLWVLNPPEQAGPVARNQVTAVSATWLRSNRVVSIAISGDGQRAAVLSTTKSGKQARLDLAGIIRNDQGVPTALAPPRRLAPTLGSGANVAWLDTKTLVLLGTLTSGADTAQVRPIIIGAAGDMSALTPVSDATAVASSGGIRDLVLTNSKGQILIRSGTAWVQLADGTDFVMPAG